MSRLFWHYMLLIAFASNVFIPAVFAQGEITPKLALQNSQIEDQDDMCIWIHPDPELSTVISSDKDAYKLFVYDLQGKTLQTIPVKGKPGNIDLRYNFPLSGQKVDIVAWVDRDRQKIMVWKVDPSTRLLSEVGEFDAGKWPEEPYGICLYRSAKSGKFYAIASGKSSLLRQWELRDNGDGTIGGMEKRSWQNGSPAWTEGLVADDETGKLYAANEEEGIYKYDANPSDPNPAGQLILPTGSFGLTPDVEGIAIYYAAGGEGYLLISNQGADNFKVFERKEPHRLVTTFSVKDAEETDGIDVTNINLGGDFSRGIFLLHNNKNEKKEILVCDFGDLGLSGDTGYWKPRKPGKSKFQSDGKPVNEM